MTQHQKILSLHQQNEWVCNNTYRANFIFSPHKRRYEIEKHLTRYALPNYEYTFEDRPCVHDSKNVRDYRLVIAQKEIKKPEPLEPKVVKQQAMV